MFKDAAQGIAKRSIKIDEVIPILEYISGKFSVGWIFMAELLDEFGEPDDQARVLESLMKYVEKPNSQSYPASDVWKRIAAIHEGRGNLYEALDALAQTTRQPGTTVDDLSDTAIRINSMLRARDKSDLDRHLKDTLIQDVVNEMESHLDSLNADDCSKLAWLYMNTGDEYNARRVAEQGLAREHDNQHCQKLLDRLERNVRW